jgi:hypothetical protein
MPAIMLDVVTSMEEFIYERLEAVSADVMERPFQGRYYPGIAPARETYPLMTFDLGYSDVAQAAVGYAAGNVFNQRWEFNGWIEGKTRLPLRLELAKVFGAFLKDDGTPQTWKFTSDIDGGQWDIVVSYIGPMATPSRIVDDEGTYARVTHAFKFDIVYVGQEQ